MKRKTFIIFLVILSALVLFRLVSCLSTRELDKDRNPENSIDWTMDDKGHNARNCIDWEGVYTGTIPWASERINVRLKLYEDERFELEYEYLDRIIEPVNYFPGSFQWDDTGSIIIIEIIDTITCYRVGSNKLIQLDLSEKQLSGKPAGDFILKKER